MSLLRKAQKKPETLPETSSSPKKSEEEAPGEQCAAEEAKGAASAAEISTQHTEKDPASLASDLLYQAD